MGQGYVKNIIDGGLEDIEVSEFAKECNDTINTIRFLFMQPSTTAGCFSTDGYVTYAMKTLEKAILIPMNGGLKVVGGPGRLTDAIKLSVLQEIQCWGKLAICTIKVEYPSFSLLMQFHPFFVQGAGCDYVVSDEHLNMLKRLAVLPPCLTGMPPRCSAPVPKL